MTAICPDGHVSATDDYCDQCGAPIGAARGGPAAGQETELLPALTSVAARAPVDLDPCPDCGATRAEADRFCEDCGHDFSGNGVPSEPAADASCWRVVVTAERERFDRYKAGGVEFPTDFTPLTIALEEPEVALGRNEVGGDPAVSRAHVRFVRRPGGTYDVIDGGSSNGTLLNDDPSPIAPHVPVPLGAGDRVQIGAWTTLRLLPPNDVD
jgi:hypothetical protein